MAVVPTARRFTKKVPHPTRERRAGLRTDLVSPTPAKTQKREVVPNG
jgi:hypothetical protein